MPFAATHVRIKGKSNIYFLSFLISFYCHLFTVANERIAIHLIHPPFISNKNEQTKKSFISLNVLLSRQTQVDTPTCFIELRLSRNSFFFLLFLLSMCIICDWSLFWYLTVFYIYCRVVAHETSKKNCQFKKKRPNKGDFERV